MVWQYKICRHLGKCGKYHQSAVENIAYQLNRDILGREAYDEAVEVTAGWWRCGWRHAEVAYGTVWSER
jgi:hypothetical protein